MVNALSQSETTVDNTCASILYQSCIYFTWLHIYVYAQAIYVLSTIVNESYVCVHVQVGVGLRGFPYVTCDPHNSSPTWDRPTCTGLPHGIDPYGIVVTQGIDPNGLLIPHGNNLPKRYK